MYNNRMKKKIPSQQGFLTLPLILGGLAIIGVIITIIYIFSGNNSGPVLPSVNETMTPPTANAPVRDPLVWGNLGPGTYPRTIEPKKQAIESLSLGGQGKAILKIETRNSKIKVELKNEDHQLVTNSSLVKQTTIKQPGGKTTFVFEIKSNPTAGTKDWQLIVSNPNSNTPANYDLTVSEASQISANSNAGDVNSVLNETADLSLTLEETISLGVTVPVINALVIANITDPNGKTSSITLTEDVNSPGTYTGTFNEVTTPGTYQITYTISGENSEGQHFDQVVTDQFTVPDPNLNQTPPNPTYQSTKKFDINQAEDIRPVY